ncbi:helix-turn-helix domain-containing protein [Ruegeria sp. HKCCD7221]|uniref:helix-turn-helix domain-containing protein n=1 Tax=Ruegeria sp. HKCCD7221 TaxID=2683009 RepID=UPI001488CC90|nr:helix-turn-helix domain-containing protein [Ruegeria sp. HKCCD7221]
MKTNTNNPLNLRHPHMKLAQWCKHFGLSRAMAHKLIRNGQLKSFKIGGATIIHGNSIADLLEVGGYDDATAARAFQTPHQSI